eukprot:347353-Chlamydomonas_euryale.AAC.2
MCKREYAASRPVHVRDQPCKPCKLAVCDSCKRCPAIAARHVTSHHLAVKQTKVLHLCSRDITFMFPIRAMGYGPYLKLTLLTQ